MYGFHGGPDDCVILECDASFSHANSDTGALMHADGAYT